MKHYKVTYYDGKEKRFLYLQAKSINQAVEMGKQQLRLNKIKGATVITAERIKGEEMPILVINKAALGSMSVDEFAAAYTSPQPVIVQPCAELPRVEKGIKEKIRERFTRNRPMQTKHLSELRRYGIDLLERRK